MTAHLPCKQPKVPVVQGAKGHTTYCLVPGCASWSYGPGLKTDVEEQAKLHRGQHKGAVPPVSVIRAPGAEPYHVECACGFVRCDGTTTTRTDAEGVRDRHLVSEHGLVSCP